MWRRTERASLEKKPSTRFSQEPCLGVKVNSKRPVVLLGKRPKNLCRQTKNILMISYLPRRGEGNISR